MTLESGEEAIDLEPDLFEGTEWERKPVLRHCRYCGKPFLVDEEVGLYWYCSFACKEQAKLERKRRRKEAGRKGYLKTKKNESRGAYLAERVCPICGRKFKYQRSRPRKYCSEWCALIARAWAPAAYYVFWRDGFRCRYCGRTPADGVRLVIDHVYPRSRARGNGEVNHPINLVTSCEACNSHKGSTLFDRELITGSGKKI